MIDVRRWSSLLTAGAFILGSATAARAESGGDDLAARYDKVRARHAPAVAKLPGVKGTGIGPSREDPNRTVIYLYVARDAPASARQALPSELDGAPVEIVELEIDAPL